MLTPFKVYEALEESRAQAAQPRKNRLSMYRELLGRHFNLDDNVNRPMNPLRHSLLVLRSLLCAKHPRFEVSSGVQAVRGDARMYEWKMNRNAEELDFRRLNRLICLEAMLSPRAVVRCGVRAGEDILGETTREANIGEWYLRMIDMDDHALDPRCRVYEEAAWEADCYSAPREMVLASGLYDNAIIEGLGSHAERVSPTVADRVRDLSGKRRRSSSSDLIEMIDLWDVHLYDLAGDGKTVRAVLPVDYRPQDFLAIAEHQGPTRGPYHWMEFDQIPFQQLAFSPGAQQLEQHNDTIAVLQRWKEAVENSRTKPVFGMETSEEEIAAVTEDSSRPIRMRDPKSAQVLDQTVISPMLVEAADRFIGFSNIHGRNPQMLSGAGSQAGTATEFQGLMGMLQAQLDDMRHSIDDFWSRIGRDMLWREVHDPRVNYQTAFAQPSGREWPVAFSAEQKEGEFVDFVLKVKPGSTMFVDKAIQGRQLIDLMGQVMPMLQVEVASGGMVSGVKALEILFRRLGEDEMASIIQDPEMIREEMMRIALAGGFPGMGQAGAPTGQRAQATGERRAIDEGRSARSAGVPAGVGA